MDSAFGVLENTSAESRVIPSILLGFMNSSLVERGTMQGRRFTPHTSDLTHLKQRLSNTHHLFKT